MTTTMTAAQQAQQKNRLADGRYTEKAQADPGTALLDSDTQLAADLTNLLVRADRAHSDQDADALESLDFDVPPILSALAARYADDPAFADVIADYQAWHADFQAQLDADDEGGDADLSSAAESIARLFADRLASVGAAEG